MSVPPSELVHCRVVNGCFGRNLNLAGCGTGATLGCVPIESGFLEMVASWVTSQPGIIDRRSRRQARPGESVIGRAGVGLWACDAEKIARLDRWPVRGR